MKILFVTECLGSGGAERQLVGLASMLKGRGYDVSVLTYDERNFYKPQLDAAGVNSECYGKALNKYTRFFLLSKKAESFKADIIVSFLPGSNIALALGKRLGLIKSKLIVSERNYTLNWSFKTKLFFKIQRKNIIENTGSYRHKQIVSIQNFIDSNYFVNKNTSDKIGNNIVCVARLRSYKNVLGFLDCIKELKQRGHQFTVNWYGHDYNDSYSKEVKNKINELGIDGVFYLHQPSSNILEVYRRSSVLCLPSFREGYPNVVIEAMSCELPIICSNVCENPNIVQDGVNGFLFNPYDVNSMVAAIEKYFALSQLERTQMGRVNREKVVKNNSMASFVNKYVQLFEKVLYGKWD